MEKPLFRLGVDLGSVSVSAVLIDRCGRLVDRHRQPHEGRIEAAALSTLARFDSHRPYELAVSSDSPAVLPGAAVFDAVVCLVRGVRQVRPKTRSILNVGGEKFSLVLFDDAGDYRKIRGNSPCAAGTGSFQDQQVRRLAIAGSAELAGLAAANRGPVPTIASRCSVFAKTDLIHAQQEGCSIEAVCDGLCQGLARALVDTLFSGERVLEPLVMSGGLAENEAVRRHLEKLTGLAVLRDELSPFFGALGAALSLDGQGADRRLVSVERAPGETADEHRYAHPPLELKTEGYPDFAGKERRLHADGPSGPANPVEVDIYRDLAEASDVVLGLDIGSTSTKAVLVDGRRRILAGFYLRTAGNPVRAVQSIFDAVERSAARAGANLKVKAAATTGSGRKFIGALIRADLILDEITAHAAAAVELKPDVDTIIEIGGQDAKFTRLRDGQVTFSRMNTVCAAGTGSFLEEQAAKLGVGLADYARLASGARAPLTSDRCTVFMERDINHYLARNYSISEMLASALYAVCENYFHKVAAGSRPGRVVCFQGATAKNPALVAVFERKLGAPIYVSPWCHLTGAYGAALEADRAQVGPSGFRGFGLARQAIPLSHEPCELCRNRCKLTVALVAGEKVSFGHQCGRDDGDAGRRRERSGFRLAGRWNEAFAFERGKPRLKTTIGLPAALHLLDELPLWKKFFDELGLPVLTSEGLKGAVAEGKRLSRAEFCAPMAEFLGHVAYLEGKADLIFVPHYLDEHDGGRKTWCYYTQFAACLAGQFARPGTRLASPLVRSITLKPNAVVGELREALERAGVRGLDSKSVGRAWKEASSWYSAARVRLADTWRTAHRGDGDVEVVLLGRPYTVLSGALNKNIPDLFDRLGVRCFSSEMAPAAAGEAELPGLPWRFASRMLAAAETAARTPGLYPVMITAFKCTPDSYLLDMFKRLCEAHAKPYLVLQIDEHDSNVGYETRIEAGVRSFRNHRLNERAAGRPPAARPARYGRPQTQLERGRPVFFPNWDGLTLPLIAAAFRRDGFDARVLPETSQQLMSGMRHNSGQCIPASVIAEDFLDALAAGAPPDSQLWLPRCTWACNIPLLPGYVKTVLEDQGRPSAGVFAGDLTFMDVSPLMTVNAFCAYLFGGALRRLVCRTRPYENVTGAAEAALAEALAVVEAAMLAGEDYEKAMQRTADIFSAVAVGGERKPRVAVFGDFYSRDNEIMNQDLVRCIERAGGEAHITPYSDFVKIIAGSYFQRMLKEQNIIDLVRFAAILPWLEHLEGRYMRPLAPLLGEPFTHRETGAYRRAGELGLRLEHEGESFDNALKIFHIVERHPGLRLLVQANPAFCCPSLVTEAMGGAIERLTGVPLLTITYDGTGAPKNQLIAPYLAFGR